MVAIEDASVDHGIATDLDHKEVTRACEVFGERQRFFNVLFGKNTCACRDVTHKRDVSDRASLHGTDRHRLVGKLDGSWLRGVSPQEALILERPEMSMHGGRR